MINSNTIMSRIVALKLLSLLFSFSLFNCTVHKNIYLKKDGSVLLNFSDDAASQWGNHYLNSQIENLSLNEKGEINFTMRAIDSLGNYLSPVFNNNIFKFDYRSDSLFIEQAGGEVFRKNYKQGVHLIIRVRSERRIKRVLTDNNYVKRKGSEILIKKSRASFNDANENLKVCIVFEK